MSSGRKQLSSATADVLKQCDVSTRLTRENLELQRGEATSTTAKRVPKFNARTGGDLEAAYQAFCKAGRPMTTVLIFIGGIATVIAADAYVNVRTTTPFLLDPLYNAVRTFMEEILFASPALIAAIRGRKYLKSILVGNLSVFAMIGTGAGVGCACVLISSVISLPYLRPIFDSRGFLNAFGSLPVTAYLLGPIGEEMLFQAGVQTSLQRFGPIAAVLGATIPFWCTHLYGGFVPLHVAIFNLFPVILAYALVRQITKSFGAAVLAHSTYNLLVSCLYFVPR